MLKIQLACLKALHVRAFLCRLVTEKANIRHNQNINKQQCHNVMNRALESPERSYGSGFSVVYGIVLR